MVNEAALLAARKNRDAVLRADFEEAIERVVAGLEKKNRRMNEREKEIVAHHEAGHAVVGWMLPARRAGAQGLASSRAGWRRSGYTMSLPLEDRYLMSLDELRDKMAAMMGGRAAEEIFIGEISTGASNDLKQATEHRPDDGARLRHERRSGRCAGGASGRARFLRSARLPELRTYSEQTARMVDDEVRKLVSGGAGPRPRPRSARTATRWRRWPPGCSPPRSSRRRSWPHPRSQGPVRPRTGAWRARGRDRRFGA